MLVYKLIISKSTDERKISTRCASQVIREEGDLNPSGIHAAHVALERDGFVVLRPRRDGERYCYEIPSALSKISATCTMRREKK